MKYTEYKNPDKFLAVCRPVFMEKEPLYGLMLGITLRLIKHTHYYGGQPLLATIESETGLDLIALMTPPYKLQVASPNDYSLEAIRLLASSLHENGWHVPAVMGERKVVKAFEANWNEIAGTRSHTGMRQRLYELRTVLPIKIPGGSLRKAQIDDLELSRRWGKSFYRDCFGDSEPVANIDNLVKNTIEEGNLFFWVNPEPVSMAALTRPTIHGVSISYVYTPPHLRGNGYASAVVACLSRHALESGKKFCTLFTDLSNPTSNSIYQKIGYDPVADIMEIQFTDAKSSAL